MEGRSEAEDGGAVDALGVRRLSGLFGSDCCHCGNGHSGATAPDYGPEPDTGRGAPRIYTANRARCTVAGPQRPRPRHGRQRQHGRRMPRAQRRPAHNTRQPRQPSRPYHYREGLRGQDHAGRRCPWLPRRLARPGTQALGCLAHSQISSLPVAQGVPFHVATGSLFILPLPARASQARRRPGVYGRL